MVRLHAEYDILESLRGGENAEKRVIKLGVLTIGNSIG